MGAVITIMLAAVLRFGSGPAAVGRDNFVYGILPVLFIIHPPQAIDRGIVGSLLARLRWAGS